MPVGRDYFLFYFYSNSFCNFTHTKVSTSNEKIVAKILPNLFQQDLVCAGAHVGNQGSCKGDSGGPLMVQDLTSLKWTQIGIVHGSIGTCGDVNYPGIYVRLNHPAVINFINVIVESKNSSSKIANGTTPNSHFHTHKSNTLILSINCKNYIFMFYKSPSINLDFFFLN